jgi:P pilus assembly chaperone PapD
MTTRHRTLAIALAVAASAIAASPSPRAAGFDARPVTIETRGGNVAAITVTNPGDRKIYLQNSVQEWRQDPSEIS